MNCTDRVEKSVSENTGRALSVALKENDMEQADFDAAVMKRPQWPQDCDRLIRVANDRLGVRMSRAEAVMVWEEWSRDMAAGWMNMHEGDEGDDELERAIRWFVERP